MRTDCHSQMSEIQQDSSNLDSVTMRLYSSLTIDESKGTLPGSYPGNCASDKQMMANIIEKSSMNAASGSFFSDGEETSQANVPKEKTPMSYVNELARFNKIHHEYRLVDEQGPAHMKTFYIILQLGTEQYRGEGKSIRKAQQMAAQRALEQTQFTKPPEKPTAQKAINHAALTPTVELNALAMKRGEAPMYTNVEFNNQFLRPHDIPTLPTGVGGSRWQQKIYSVRLTIGGQEFHGQGVTRQAAKHDAATKALFTLKRLPLPPRPAENDDDEETLNGKSAISRVYEACLKRRLEPVFQVLNESGPSHMKHFTLTCTVGEVRTDGSGASKKIAKTAAAEAMLVELNKLQPLTAEQELPLFAAAKRGGPRKKPKNLVGQDILVRALAENGQSFGSNLNPISRLLMLQQMRRGPDPVYEMVEEKVLGKRREFTMKVSLPGFEATGKGANKKTAKKAAAESMLATLGVDLGPPPPNKSAIRRELPPMEKHVSFNEEKNPGAVAPGLLWVGQVTPQPCLSTAMPVAQTQKVNMNDVSAMARQMLDGHARGQITARPTQQLQQMASIMGFCCNFNEFPVRGSTGTLISMVTINTNNNPLRIFHGEGRTRDEAQDNAATAALQTLANINLLPGPVGENRNPPSQE